jgi:hypothetical protein
LGQRGGDADDQRGRNDVQSCPLTLATRGLPRAPQILNTPGAGGPGATHDSGFPPAEDAGGDEASWDERRLRALSKEVDILANLRHPNVVMFLGVCLRPPCVVTEFCALGERAAVGAGVAWPQYQAPQTWHRLHRMDALGLWHA